MALTHCLIKVGLPRGSSMCTTNHSPEIHCDKAQGHQAKLMALRHDSPPISKQKRVPLIGRQSKFCTNLATHPHASQLTLIPTTAPHQHHKRQTCSQWRATLPLHSGTLQSIAGHCPMPPQSCIEAYPSVCHPKHRFTMHLLSCMCMVQWRRIPSGDLSTAFASALEWLTSLYGMCNQASRTRLSSTLRHTR